MVTDDFSFPTITVPVPNYTKSTSLWRVPSVVFTESCNGDNTGGIEDLSTFKGEEEENSQGNSTRGTEDSSTIKTDDENFQENSSRGTEDSSIIKTDDENFQENSSRGREDSSTIKTDDESFQRNSSLLTVTDSMRSIDNEEEKMDMLWENFNDVELSQVYSLNKKKEMGKLLGSEFDSNKDEERVEVSCVGSSTILSPRRPSLLLILKVLKKLFLLQNAHCPKRNTSIDLF